MSVVVVIDIFSVVTNCCSNKLIQCRTDVVFLLYPLVNTRAFIPLIRRPL